MAPKIKPYFSFVIAAILSLTLSCSLEKPISTYVGPNQKIGVFNSEGKIIFRPIFEKVSGVYNNRLWVENQSFTAIITSQGRYEMLDTNKNILPLLDSEVYAINDNGRVVLVQKSSTRKVSINEDVVSFEESFKSNRLNVSFSNGKKGFIDRNGNIIFETNANLIFGYSDDVATVQKIDSVFYVDPLGKLLFAFSGKGSPFSEGLALIRSNQNHFFINKKGEVVLDCSNYDWVDSFNSGLALVKLDNRFGYINSSGVLKIPLVYQKAESFINGYAAVKLKESAKWVFINRKGERVNNKTYFYISRGLTEGGFAALAKLEDGDQWVYIDVYGNIFFRIQLTE